MSTDPAERWKASRGSYRVLRHSILLGSGLLPASLDLFRGRKATDRALRVIVMTAELLASGTGHRLHHLLATRAVDRGPSAELPAAGRADEGFENDCFHSPNALP